MISERMLLARVVYILTIHYCLNHLKRLVDVPNQVLSMHQQYRRLADFVDNQQNEDKLQSVLH